jgi:tubulin epsilon
VGLCSVPPAGLPYSLLQLGNNCCIRNTFTAMEERFQKLYKKKVYLHHYTQYMDASCFDQAAATVRDLVDEYAALDGDGDPAAAAAPHMHPVGVDSRQPSRESALKGLQ